MQRLVRQWRNLGICAAVCPKDCIEMVPESEFED